MAHDQAGSTVVEVAVVIPAAMLVVLFAVQMCIWAHAATLVQDAADQGNQVASEAGGSPSAGVDQAKSFLAVTAGSIVVDPSVRVSSMSGDMLRFSVAGSAESIIPGFHFSVSAVRVGSLQEFRVSG